ncbi:hypothetical protein Q9233_013990 [Columba guinea]|nr:hypothetical protein Q9233_013990 [Columba guinea]
MATRGLLEMLNAAIGTPHLGVVDLVALHKLLEAIIGQLGQQELSVLEPGQSLTPGLAKDQDSKDQPGQEKEEDGALGTGQHLWKPEKQLDEKVTLEGTGSNFKVSSMAKEAMPKTTEEEERDVSKKRASLRDLWEEINKFKEAHSGLEQDVRAMQQAMQEAHSGLEQDIQEMKEAHVGLAEDMHALQEAYSGLAEDIQEIQETLGLPGSSSSQATIPGDAQEPAKPWGSTSTSSYESEMREVLSQVGQLGQLCAGLKEQVEQLKSTKAESADLENVRRLFPKGGQESITSTLADLKCQMSFLQDMARTLHGEEEKISRVEDAPRKTRESGAGRKVDGSGQMTRQPRPKGQKVKAERKELGKQQEPTQAKLKQFAAKYVNKFVMETAQQLQAEQPDEPRATAQSGGHEHAGCHVCSPDTRVLLGKLLQRCEKLEEQVESLVQKAGGKVESHPKWRRQALSQALERLEKKQADKEELLVLGIDEKADKAALADKVSRSQLEACEERLNKMMEEVTSQVTGQEKGWHQFQKDLQRQMDCKLDRRELGAFRKQQEERWKSLSGQLQEKALQAERDDAAGIRKQLLPGFHCLSCDRPLNMLAPGPEWTGECRYSTVPRSCGGPHTVTPPRFQPQPPSTPRPSPSSAPCPNKKDAMQLSGQDGTDGNQQDEQLSVMGGSELPTTPRATPDISTSRNQPTMGILAVLALPLLLFGISGIIYIYQTVRWLLSKSAVQNKVVVITDATSGLGKECSRVFHTGGARLVLCGRTWEKLETLYDALISVADPSMTYAPKLIFLDISDINCIRDVAKEILNCYGCVDILINNASMKVKGAVQSISLELDKKIMDANYFGPITLTKDAASKHAAVGFFDCLRAEMEEFDISVSTVHPTFICSYHRQPAPGNWEASIWKCKLSLLSARFTVFFRKAAYGVHPVEVAEEVLRTVSSKKQEVLLANPVPRVAVYIRTFFPELFFAIVASGIREKLKTEEEN